MGLVLPAVFYRSLINNVDFDSTAESISHSSILISRGVAIISLVGYIIYIGYQTISHDGLLHEIFEADEHKDNDRHEELAKPKFTLIEALVALLISLACVALIAISLVEEIPYIVDRGVKDAFVGLILIPLVEKVAGMSCYLALFFTTSNEDMQNISLLLTKHTTTRSTWLLPTLWALRSRLRS
jgi:Ca2+:H+ antiporter